uniref:cytochrome b n=1 Tax=Elthusa poutassouiensis TaxID=3104314 RepID=UPI002E769E27|nr:cytochrome b [Elthusa poutassouiensis]WPS93557.1 cytochrome b [Elthusa poutassouiensis]
MFNLRKKDVMLMTMEGVIVKLPGPINLSSMWNFGSLLGMCLMVQIITGVMLAVHYLNYVDVSFQSVIHIMRDVNYGWLLRSIHANGASFFFIFTYLHMGRGLYYGSYFMFHVWMVGVSLLLLIMMVAFLGYVLPWGQMSFWGATVITNLLSVIPYVGVDLVSWLWGGFSISGVTLTRFFVFHFLVPFVIVGMVIVHIIYLHESGSNNPVGLSSDLSKIPFHPYYSMKDVVGFIVGGFFLLVIVLVDPYILGDPENFNFADALKTPNHIQPEWYYLFAYAILRSIPNKLGGVVALMMSIMVFYIVPFIFVGQGRSMGLSSLSKLMFWSFVTVFFILTWLGACPVEAPYIILGQMMSFMYFMYFFMFSLVCYIGLK